MGGGVLVVPKRVDSPARRTRGRTEKGRTLRPVDSPTRGRMMGQDGVLARRPGYPVSVGSRNSRELGSRILMGIRQGRPCDVCPRDWHGHGISISLPMSVNDTLLGEDGYRAPEKPHTCEGGRHIEAFQARQPRETILETGAAAALGSCIRRVPSCIKP